MGTKSVRLVAGSLCSLNLHATLCFSVLLSIIQQRLQNIALELVPKSLVFSLTCVLFLTVKRVRTKEPCKRGKEKRMVKGGYGGVCFF